jgi:hypothetical protein
VPVDVFGRADISNDILEFVEQVWLFGTDKCDTETPISQAAKVGEYL